MPSSSTGLPASNHSNAAPFPGNGIASPATLLPSQRPPQLPASAAEPPNLASSGQGAHAQDAPAEGLASSSDQQQVVAPLIGTQPDASVAEKTGQQLDKQHEAGLLSFQQLMAADIPADADNNGAAVSASTAEPSSAKVEAPEPIPGLPSSVTVSRPADWPSQSAEGPAPQHATQPESHPQHMHTGQVSAAGPRTETEAKASLATSQHQEDDEVIDIAGDDDGQVADGSGQAMPSGTAAANADSASRRTITGGAHPRIASWQPGPEAGLGPQPAYGLWGNTPYNPPYPNGHAEPATGWTVTSNWPNSQGPSHAEHSGWATAYPDVQSLINYAQSTQHDAQAAGSQPLPPTADQQLAGPAPVQDGVSFAQPDASAPSHAPGTDVPMDGSELLGDGQWAEDFERFMAANLDMPQSSAQGPQPEAGPSLPQAQLSKHPEFHGDAWPVAGAGPLASELGLHAGPSLVRTLRSTTFGLS